MTESRQFSRRTIKGFGMVLLMGGGFGATAGLVHCAEANPPDRAQYDATCKFIAIQRPIADSIVGPRTGAADKFVGETETGAREYHYTGDDIKIDYLIAKDGKKVVRSFELSGKYLREDRFGEDVLTQQLLVPMPLAGALTLGCDIDELTILKRDKRLKTLIIAARFVD
jgi:hypothetical protein